METWYVCSDIHDDVEAFSVFADYASAQEGSKLMVLGDWLLRQYGKRALKRLQEGDLESFRASKKRQSNRTLTAFKEAVDASGLEAFVLPGNYDGQEDVTNVFGDQNLHLKTARVNGFTVAGYGGADHYSPHAIPLVEMGEIVHFDHDELHNFLFTKTPDIALIHTPPQFYCDDMYDGSHPGTWASAQYVIQHNPKLILSGHIHEAGPSGNNPNGIRGINVLESPRKGKISFVINPGNLGRYEFVHPTTLDPVQEFPYGTFVSIDIEDDGTPISITQYSLAADKRGIGTVQTLNKFNLK